MASTGVNGKKFEMVKGVRYESGNKTTRTARSLGECALMCTIEESCSRFNYVFGQCELLTADASCGANTTGWTHGYYTTGKYQLSH